MVLTIKAKRFLNLFQTIPKSIHIHSHIHTGKFDLFVIDVFFIF